MTPANERVQRTMFTQLLGHLHRGGAYGYWWYLSNNNKDHKRTVWWPVGHPCKLDPSPHEHVYYGVHPTHEARETYQRSTNATIAAINCVFCEFDGDVARDDIEALVPSVLIESSPGKYHAYWLLDAPFVLHTDADRKRARDLQARWVDHVGGDRQSKDLARVLRPTGTYNVKPAYAPYPLVTFVVTEWDLVYRLEDLEDIVQYLIPDRRLQTPPSSNNTGASVIAAYNRDHTIATTLEHYGYEPRGNRYVRPGGERALTVVVDGRSFHHSGEDVLCDGYWKKPFDVYCAYEHGGNTKAAVKAYARNCRHVDSGDTGTDPHTHAENDDCRRVDVDRSSKTPDPVYTLDLSAPSSCPALPELAVLPPETAANACPWLDDYIAFSQQWSPESYDGFHEATALWLLSTVAGRRVRLHFGGERFTNLYIALCARTSLFAKSTAANIGMQVLQDAGLMHMLAPDDSTPQAFIRHLAGGVPENYRELSTDKQERLRLRLQFGAQRGWFYDEFGQKLVAMMKDGGFMADFRGLLRKFDDCPNQYEYATIGRGTDAIQKPYLALLASMTPADLQPFTTRGSALWNDGFLARWAFVAPPPDDRGKDGVFPQGQRTIPANLLTPLVQWHQSLGIPKVRIADMTNDDGEPTGHVDVDVDDLPITDCSMSEAVFQAYYTYRVALKHLLRSNENEDLDGSYTRLPEKALRIAMLLASMSNDGRIELRHWARAQQIAERWRVSLHNLIDHLQSSTVATTERTYEEKIMTLMQRNHDTPMTAREVSQGVRGLSSAEAADMLNRMSTSTVALVEALPSKRTTRYRLTEQAQPKHTASETPITFPPTDTQNTKDGTVDDTKGRLHVYASSVSTHTNNGYQSTPGHDDTPQSASTLSTVDQPRGYTSIPGYDDPLDRHAQIRYAQDLLRRKATSPHDFTTDFEAMNDAQLAQWIQEWEQKERPS